MFALPRLLASAAWSLALAGAAQAAADGLASAQAALASGDYRSAYAAYRKEAPRSALAQFTLGMFLREGWGMARDPAAACKWFEQAAAGRVPAAAHFWADCLAEGIGTAADIPRALESYDRAAEGGHLISWCSAADYHLQGRGVPQDVARGLSLCEQAAQAHSAPAMLQLARYFQQGVGMPSNPAMARHWYQRAADIGTPEAQYQLGLMLAQGEGGAVDLNAALFHLETAASAGFIPAYLPTARLYASAPVQPGTGALAPEHLAKIYLWTMAADARATSAEEKAEAGQLLAQVLSVMPYTWRTKLDRQVAEHVAKHAAISSNRSN